MSEKSRQKTTKRIINKRGLVPRILKSLFANAACNLAWIACNLFTMYFHGMKRYCGKYRSQLRVIQLGIVSMQLKSRRSIQHDGK